MALITLLQPEEQGKREIQRSAQRWFLNLALKFSKKLLPLRSCCSGLVHFLSVLIQSVTSVTCVSTCETYLFCSHSGFPNQPLCGFVTPNLTEPVGGQGARCFLPAFSKGALAQLDTKIHFYKPQIPGVYKIRTQFPPPQKK